MIIQNKHIKMVRGDSETLTYENINAETGEQVALVTGDTVYFTVKTNYQTADKSLQKVVTTFTDGKASISILPTDTKIMPFGQYVYDVQVTFANGQVKTPVVGAFTLLNEVTYE